MDRKQIDIINALYCIKGVCVSSEKCDDCPLSLNNNCILLHYSPDHWNINTEGEIWRAFK